MIDEKINHITKVVGSECKDSDYAFTTWPWLNLRSFSQPGAFTRMVFLSLQLTSLVNSHVVKLNLQPASTTVADHHIGYTSLPAPSPQSGSLLYSQYNMQSMFQIKYNPT